MQPLLKGMDDFISYWGSSPRLYPARKIVQVVGYILRKTDWVRRAFDSCNFSFILSGSGEYWLGNRRWLLEPPCVIVQRPNEPVQYGPTDGRVWEELFLIYPAQAFADLAESGFMEVNRPYWKIKNEPAWREILLEMAALARRPRCGQADRLDRFCERLVLESLLHELNEQDSSRGSLAIAKVRELLRRDPTSWPDFADLAHQMGMSAQTFRRAWMGESHLPPTRYARGLKMKEACRLLIETRQTVGEIAFRLGYRDALYFSRCFRAHYGQPATEYRKIYQVRK